MTVDRRLVIGCSLFVAVMAFIAAFFMASLGAGQQQTTAEVRALERQNAEIRAEQQQQQRDSLGFIQAFVAEINYDCQVLAAQAAKEGLPLAPPSICAVTLPTPRPPQATPRPTARPTAQPTAAPSPSPTVTPTPTKTPCPLPLCLGPQPHLR